VALPIEIDERRRRASFIVIQRAATSGYTIVTIIRHKEQRALGTGLKSPETEPRNRRFRGLDRRQRPSRRYVEIGLLLSSRASRDLTPRTRAGEDAIEGRLPPGIRVTRLRDAPAEWTRNR
jgi:hypothetical protein